MREILFRGFHECENGTQIAVVNGKEYRGEWIEGNVIKIYSEYLRREVTAIVKQGAREEMYEGLSYEEVIPETVGQFTGLKDKNGKKIFEHDRIKYKCGDIAKVIFTKYGAFVGVIESLSHENIGGVLTEVIGTIFDKEGICGKRTKY